VPFIDTKDLRIHYQIDGPASAATLVLSNSLGTNLSLWEPQLPVFVRDFRVLRYDSRGHGQTSATPGEYSVELLARDVLRLLDALKLDRVHFCGLSIGGMTGMWLGVNVPERLNKLVLCNTAAQIGNADGWNARIKTVREGGTKAVSESVIDRWFTPDFRAKNPDLMARTKAMIDGTSTDGYTGSCAAVRDFDFWARVGVIRTPTLVIAGAHDAAVPPADGQKFAHAIPGARFAELSAAHISNIEDADRFTTEVSAFLKSQEI
jgi:3-oxoadipate enol-lactonase